MKLNVGRGKTIKLIKEWWLVDVLVIWLTSAGVIPHSQNVLILSHS